MAVVPVVGRPSALPEHTDRLAGGDKGHPEHEDPAALQRRQDADHQGADADGGSPPHAGSMARPPPGREGGSQAHLLDDLAQLRGAAAPEVHLDDHPVLG